MANALTCRYCPWTTALWSKGRPTGWGRLDTHIADAHYEQYRELAILEADYYGDILDDMATEDEIMPGVKLPDPDWGKDGCDNDVEHLG